MNLFFRQLSVLLLFVLQGLSPLVHAHVQVDGGEYGLHIDGISVSTEKYAQFSSLESVGHSDAVICISSAIQHKKLLISDLPVSSSSDYTQQFIQSLFIEKEFIKKQHSFDLPVEISKLSTNVSIIAPRAPPVKI